jgi:putative ABC transport system substrate-binding protein
MRRRELIAAVGSKMLDRPGAGRTAEIVRRVAVVTAGQPRTTSSEVGFEERMRELGYDEGRNLAIIFRTAEGHAERFPLIPAEIVRQRPEAIVAVGPEANLRAIRAAAS